MNMKWKAPPGYLKKVLELAGTPGTVSSITVAHDDWCNLLARTGPCNCDPEVRPSAGVST